MSIVPRKIFIQYNTVCISCLYTLSINASVVLIHTGAPFVLFIYINTCACMNTVDFGSIRQLNMWI